MENKTRVFGILQDQPLFAGEPPLRRPEDATISERVQADTDAIIRVTDVATPTYTFYPATGNKPHPLVVVCPGGGYSILAYNHEGTDVAMWLTRIGVSVLLLKYRCPDRRDQALADARRAVRVARANATQWNLDPAKIGILGFSAGADLAVRTCISTEPDYTHSDVIDELSSKPDYAFVIYPAYLKAGADWSLRPELDASQMPPAFLCQSADDGHVESFYAFSIAMHKAGRSLEAHLFPDGGHGWGVPLRGRSHDCWTDLATKWFQGQICPVQGI